MTKECKQQFTLRITQANATQLVVILYEMTLQYLQMLSRQQKMRSFWKRFAGPGDVSMNF